MIASKSTDDLRSRNAPLDMAPDDFRALGYQVVDRVASFLETLPERPVTRDETPRHLRSLLGDGVAPRSGSDPETLLSEAVDLLVGHSLFNGHPRFWGYITSSAAPIGALADLIAAAINPNTGAWDLSPMASEIERQVIRWIAEMVGFPEDCGGILTSGGNTANFVGVLSARKAKASWDIRSEGLRAKDGGQLCMYVSAETHTWVQKAADLFGFGTDAIRWIATDGQLRMDVGDLRIQIASDIANGNKPFLVVGTAGSVSTGAIDPLADLAQVCREHDLWFHVDGAYGAFAAALPDAPDDLKALREADSLALDPHKWLYIPLEAGCTLVRDASLQRDAFSFHPPYYGFTGDDEDPQTNYHELGLQNSRGFRALKVWLALRQVGVDGYERMISDDIRLAEALYELLEDYPEVERFSHNLSITTFRFVPERLLAHGADREQYLNDLNRALLTQLQTGGEAFVSNAVVRGAFLLRLCIVNFRTTLTDIEALPDIVVRLGRALDARMRPEQLR